MHWWLAEREARAIDPRAIALLQSSRGLATETAAANFLIVRGGTVVSPPRDSVLRGVSLAVTQELCGRLEIPFEEQSISVAECKRADEGLLTGTAFCIAGVRSIDGVELNWPGPVFERLLAGWNDQVGLDIRRQILSNQ
jgi:branched-subunit amino acid aminotransferase/4-amino-4-deoxychorismate lyase